MAFTKQAAIARARQELASRLGLKETDVQEQAVDDVDFPDMALGAGVNGEMSGQMITPGWRIRFKANGQSFEYRANEQQLRLFNYQGANYKV